MIWQMERLPEVTDLKIDTDQWPQVAPEIIFKKRRICIWNLPLINLLKLKVLLFKDEY